MQRVNKVLNEKYLSAEAQTDKFLSQGNEFPAQNISYYKNPHKIRTGLRVRPRRGKIVLDSLTRSSLPTKEQKI